MYKIGDKLLCTKSIGSSITIDSDYVFDKGKYYIIDEIRYEEFRKYSKKQIILRDWSFGVRNNKINYPNQRYLDEHFDTLPLIRRRKLERLQCIK